MSVLFLVRHGQASFMAEDYDQLSAVGEAQARALAHHWAAIGLHFDRVYVGPRKRQIQTQAAIGDVYRAQNLSWPEPETMPEIDEHRGFEVSRHVLPDLIKHDPDIRRLAKATQSDDKDPRKSHLRLLQQVLQMWVRGELEADHLESWAAFRTRVRGGLDKIIAGNGSGQRIAAFTSTGPVAIAAGEALKLADEPTMELSWTVRNATYSEFFFSEKRFSLGTFNAASHFHEAELLTYV